MAITIVIVLLVIITLAFHFLSPWWFTPIASNWQSIDDTINIALWVTGLVFVLVNLFLAYVIFKYRYNRSRRATYQPENKKLETWLTLVTSFGVAAMLIPGLFVWADIIAPPKDSRIVEVVGQQWHWMYRFPGEDGRLGKTAVELIDQRNPFGIDKSDPYGQDDRLIKSNELHLPIDQPVKFVLRSKDVLHNFAVPQFRVKMDLVPGITTYVWLTPNKLGDFDVLCEELCGIAHFTMRGKVVVETEQAFDVWLDEQATFKQSINRKPPDLALGKTYYAGCVACHGQNAEGNENMNGPRLAGLGSWYIERQLHYFKQQVRGNLSEDVFGQQMAAMSALLPDETAIKAVSYYISTLTPPPSGSLKIEHSAVSQRGRELYANCAFCHGSNAEGNYATNAPRLAGQFPWYLKRQLQNYQTGQRGSHLRDLYGSQMRLMSRVLRDEQSIDEIVSYIDSIGQVVEPVLAGAGHE